MGWDGTNVPVSPGCLGGRGGGRSPREAPRLAFCAQLPAPTWGQVSGGKPGVRASTGLGPATWVREETHDQLAGGVPKTSHVCQPSCFRLR